MREEMAMATRELLREERVGSCSGLGIIGPHPRFTALLPRSSLQSERGTQDRHCTRIRYYLRRAYTDLEFSEIYKISK